MGSNLVFGPGIHNALASPTACYQAFYVESMEKLGVTLPSPLPPLPGERRTNATQASTGDLEARLYKKATGQEAKRAYRGHGLVENRHGLVVDMQVSQATGTAERETALAMVEAIPARHRITLAAAVYNVVRMRMLAAMA
jgi:hypothetical protein